MTLLNFMTRLNLKLFHSCYYLTLPEKLGRLREHGFNSNEIKRIEFSLLELTNNIVNPVYGLYKKDLQRINELTANHDVILASDLTVIEKVYWLVEYCKRYGTLPFAGVARAAFIAVQFLGSFVESGVMTIEERSLFLGSLNTVTKQLQSKLCKTVIRRGDS
jgi:glutamine kinase